MNVFAFLLAGYGLFSHPPLPRADAGGDIDKTDLRVCCDKIRQQGQRIWFLSDRNGRVRLQIRGVYVHGSVLLFFLQLNNRSSVDYTIGNVSFLLAGNNRGRGTRPAALEPLFIYDSTKMVPGFSRAASIFVLPRFRLPAGGRLWIDVQESDGNRHLHIPVNNWTLARARVI
ncbi:MAG TPA: DUF4138 domain-containing protein [Puia sp.]|nr:DUF4138 domain-containing protein [Puia sp.]